MRTELEKRYFTWLCDVISKKDRLNYKKLLEYLYERSFFYILPMDGNRLEDGIDLRYSGFGYFSGTEQYEIARYLDRRDCSVLEMMVALTIRMENIVGDSELGDRKGLWFWSMVESLGLNEMDDDNYDETKVVYRIDCFLNRDYKPDGKGGLFTVKEPFHDMRGVEIWSQMCWYLSENA